MIINTIHTTQCQPQTIVIGRRGTYDTMQIAFDLSNLIDAYGNGVAVLAVKRSQDESAYPAVTTQADNTLTWTVSETDTAYVGAGECQLMWYVDGGLAKTIIYPMAVMRDILATSEEAPDAYQTWVDDLTALGAETLQNAQNAEQSASDAESAKDDAVTAKKGAKAAQQAAETAVTHYPKIENNYWMVWDSTSQSYVSTGIQAEGEDGYSPEITITSITGGHRVIITDKDHPQGQSFDVMDGQGGGTSNYADLSNKPKINNVELNGNKTAHDLGLAAQSDIPTVPVQSVNGKIGAVNLASGDIAYDESATYQAGSVGAELQEQTRHLSDVEENQIPELKNVISQLQPAATASDIGKALIVKTVDAQTGKPTSYEYGDGSGGAVDDVQINGTSIVSSGVANIPVGTVASPGVVRALAAYGMAITNDGLIHIVGANQTAQFKALNELYTPVTLSTATTVLFYALAKLAGDATLSASDNPVGTYTEGAKSAIHGMLNGAVTVSGTTPTIAAKDGITYVCGEVATLDITIPASGIVDVTFTSGSTATVLTITAPTGVTLKWANGFDPTALEANTTYEINILNGLGVAAWT